MTTDTKDKARDYGNFQGHPMWPKLKRLYQDASSRETMVFLIAKLG